MSSLDTRAIDPKDLKQAAAPVVKQEFRVFLSEDAFDRAVARGESDTSREIGGVLVGQLLRDDNGPYLLIDTTIDALHADEKGAEVTFTHATWKHIHEEMDQHHDGKTVVGWYHTHPGFGVFLSDRDQFIQKSFFNLPHQIAFVYDPKSKEHGVFVWRDNTIVRARRYWVGPQEQSFDGPRNADAPPPRRQTAAIAAATPAPERTAGASTGFPAIQARPDPEQAEPMAPMMQLLVTGAICLLLGGLAGNLIGSGCKRGGGGAPDDELKIQLAQARGEGAQQAVSAIQQDLVGILRDTIGDEAVKKPVSLALGEVQATITALEAARSALGGKPGEPKPAEPKPAEPKPSEPAGSGSGSGSGGASAAPTAPTPATPLETIDKALARLALARDTLVRLREDRGSAEAALKGLSKVSKRDSVDQVLHELAGQRAGIGRLYAELAEDAVRAGDPKRARSLLGVAAKLDPGNRARYEKQLQTFDKSGTLPGGAPAAGDKR